MEQTKNNEECIYRNQSKLVLIFGFFFGSFDAITIII